MKTQTRKLIFIISILSIGNLVGCFPLTSKITSTKEIQPWGSDKIVAIGRPTPQLAKTFGHDHVIAFIGLSRTYLLYKGGEEIEHLSQAKLDGRLIYLGYSKSNKLFVKDNRSVSEILCVRSI